MNGSLFILYVNLICRLLLEILYSNLLINLPDQLFLHEKNFFLSFKYQRRNVLCYMQPISGTSSALFSTISLLEQNLNCRVLNQINELLFRYDFFAANNRLICLLPCISQFSIIAAKLPHLIQS